MAEKAVPCGEVPKAEAVVVAAEVAKGVNPPEVSKVVKIIVKSPKRTPEEQNHRCKQEEGSFMDGPKPVEPREPQGAWAVMQAKDVPKADSPDAAGAVSSSVESTTVTNQKGKPKEQGGRKRVPRSAGRSTGGAGAASAASALTGGDSPRTPSTGSSTVDKSESATVKAAAKQPNRVERNQSVPSHPSPGNEKKASCNARRTGRGQQDMDAALRQDKAEALLHGRRKFLAQPGLSSKCCNATTIENCVRYFRGSGLRPDGEICGRFHADGTNYQYGLTGKDIFEAAGRPLEPTERYLGTTWCSVQECIKRGAQAEAAADAALEKAMREAAEAKAELAKAKREAAEAKREADEAWRKANDAQNDVLSARQSMMSGYCVPFPYGPYHQ